MSELLQFEGNNYNLHRLLAHGDEKILRCFTQQKGAQNTTNNHYQGTEEQP